MPLADFRDVPYETGLPIFMSGYLASVLCAQQSGVVPTSQKAAIEGIVSEAIPAAKSEEGLVRTDC